MVIAQRHTLQAAAHLCDRENKQAHVLMEISVTLDKEKHKHYNTMFPFAFLILFFSMLF